MKVLLRGNCEAAEQSETYVREVSPYQGEGMFGSSYSDMWATEEGERIVALFLILHKMKLGEKNVSRRSLFTFTSTGRHTSTDWREKKGNGCVSFTFAWKTTFALFFSGGSGAAWQKCITAAAFSRDRTTSIMWREVLSSCSGLFLFAL